MKTDAMDTVEAESFQQQALEIRMPGPDFDPNAVPQNGEEYLMKMFYERKHCPAVMMRKPKKVVIATPSAAVTFESDKDLLRPHAALLPTPEWKEMQASDFLATRKKIALLRCELSEQNYDPSLEPPLTADADEWMSFCKHQPPLLRTILRISQRGLERLLEYISEWMQSDNVSEHEQDSAGTTVTVSASSTMSLSGNEEWLGAWLYAALACLLLPLEPNVHSTLREIARNCIRLRSNLRSHQPNEAVPYNLFIYLIAKVFDQLDLTEFV